MESLCRANTKLREKERERLLWLFIIRKTVVVFIFRNQNLPKKMKKKNQ